MQSNFFWTIFFFFPLISYSSAGVNVTLYADKDHSCSSGIFSRIFSPSATCVTLEFEDDECINLNDHDEKISSINTHGNCFVVWHDSECTGHSLRIFPGSPNHHDLSRIDMVRGVRNWEDEISSIRPCPPNCTLNQFRCVSEKCIKSSYVCDGDRDCPHGDDELNCPVNSTVQNLTTTTVRPETSSEVIKKVDTYFTNSVLKKYNNF